MCLLALDCCLVDVRNCRFTVPLDCRKVVVHVCQALLRMQHCDIAGGSCGVLVSHNSICNISHVKLHSIDASGVAAGILLGIPSSVLFSHLCCSYGRLCTRVCCCS